jgi:two-component system response regulator PilR (NtrC family)
VGDYRVLVVDDERNIRNVLKIHLRRQGIYCDTASSMYEALKKMEEEPFDIFILDLKLPDGDGIQILREAKRRNPHSVAVLLTAYGTVDTAVEAMKIGALDFIAKPFKVSAFKELMDVAFKQLDFQRVQEEGAHLSVDWHALGKSGALRDVMVMVNRLALSDAPVLIVGETGTGKDFIARIIHEKSPRSEAPFLKVEASDAVPQDTEMDIFGFEGGRRGFVELTHGGTLYIAKVEHLTSHIQSKLLNLLEERVYRMPGSLAVEKADVRLLFSVEEDPSSLVEKGRLNGDFYYRLKNLTIQVPPLRERKEDIPHLLNRFLVEFGEKYGKKITGFTPGFLKRVEGCSFPGNVRELESLVERCVVLSHRDVFHEDLLPPGLEGEHGESLDTLLENVEKEMIMKALKEAGGVKTKAAEMLGISFRSLRYRLKKLGLTT